MSALSAARGRPFVLLASVVVVAALLVVVCGFGASASAATGSCSNEAFRTGPSAGLPDCRAYEMVSPPNKNGGEVDGGINFGELVVPEQAAADGEAITYGSTSAFVDANPASAMVASQYVSRRTANGWRTEAVVPEQELPGGKAQVVSGSIDYSLFQGFAENLDAGFLLAWEPQPDPSAPAGYYNPYLWGGSSDRYELLSAATPPVKQPSGPANLIQQRSYGVLYAGMSQDRRHVIFAANDALTPEATPGEINLYEWSEGQLLELVNVYPDGEVDSVGRPEQVLESKNSLVFGSPTEGPDGLQEGQIPSGYPFNFSGALSSDGTRAFWTDSDYQVYLHELVGAGSRTVEVSASQKSGHPSGGAPAQYWTANSDGSLVYFTSSEQLTADSTAAGTKPDLYQYDVQTGALNDLTVDGNAGEAADVLGVMGAGESSGVSYVYFVARGMLAEGAVAGAQNVYLWQGVPGSGVVKFIGKLGEHTGYRAGEHKTGSNLEVVNTSGEESDFTEAVMLRTSRVSPDGRLLAFQSVEPLTGYDNVSGNGQACPEPPLQEAELAQLTYGNPEGRCMEVFEYDAQTGRLVCASCDPRGLPPTGDSLVPETPHLLADSHGWESSTAQQRYLLDDGRLFFQSEDALLPEATNGRLNVYEYEPEDTGQCTESTSASGGCLYLISTGQSSENAYFLDASADGRDVFITTREQLVPQDGDGAIDVYDAREDGGFSVAQPPPCSGEACRPAVTPAPAIYGAPSSATFQGAVGDSASASKVAAAKVVKKKPPKRKKLKRGKRKAGRAKAHRANERRGKGQR